ncbi:MAG: hypothetical protein HWN81_22295 [Candidatus Lokiarchaeota archaeon]|nr:hypothetical protein [Candidatus Lokiarchaeota archaeon]
MKNCIKYITLISIFVFWLFPCNAEELTIYQIKEQMNIALEDMDNALQKLSEKYDEFKPEHPMGKTLWSALEKSRENIKFIYSSKIIYSELFLSTLEYDTEVFRRFIQFASIGRIPLSISSAVLDASLDLELKSRLIKTSETDQVEVKVNTINKQGEDINNCTVWYVPFIKDDDEHKLKFDRLSTPTTGMIPAGKWLIWTEKKGKLGPKVPFLCGDDGRREREIDIFSPE